MKISIVSFLCEFVNIRGKNAFNFRIFHRKPEATDATKKVNPSIIRGLFLTYHIKIVKCYFLGKQNYKNYFSFYIHLSLTINTILAVNYN